MYMHQSKEVKFFAWESANEQQFVVTFDHWNAGNVSTSHDDREELP
jgi:hypothetical protein